ncbi:hypothetical protein Fmac_012030 [Flemingia macrophylla]|uniref:BHLH domain-containing protein n=1 Tax=Flemingia macrophylla TaxID=520843 RepID=A0ABD1MP58_9FABA
MSQRVPSCDVDDNINNINIPNPLIIPDSNFIPNEVPMLGCKKGHTPSTWDKPRESGGTLESIVNQRLATNCYNFFTTEALVPCFSKQPQVAESKSQGACKTGSSARVVSALHQNESGAAARVPTSREFSSSRDLSGGGSDTCHVDLSAAFNSFSASMGSPENTTSSAKHCTANDDRDSISLLRSLSEAQNEDYKTRGVGRYSESNKRIKASAVHNQSERRRRDKINKKMMALQKLVPNSSKTDKASMLDEVIQYMKQLQAQVEMMNWMNMYSSMMLPTITMQHQLKMSMMMAQMCIGMGMNKDMGMNIHNNINMNTNFPTISPLLHPTPFMPMASCGIDRLQGAPEKSVNMDAYSRMAALYHQLYHPS